MTSRVLPVEEWPRLRGTEAETLWPHLDPTMAQVLVVEDGGEIVGTWVLVKMVHAECVWIAPAYRGSFGVAKRLLVGMRRLALACGVKTVWTSAMSDHVRSLIGTLQGVRLPGEHYVLPLERASCQQQ